MPGESSIVDTVPRFLAWWAGVAGQPLDAQIEGWAREAMSDWPELLAVQQADYAGQGLDWRDVARERIWPFLPQRLPAMLQAREALLTVVEPVYRRAQTVLGLDFDVVFVVYIGLGCGAGWATTYAGRPAVLYGLENVAECGWIEEPALAGLTAHELSHLAFQHWRTKEGLLAEEDDPYWLIYDEGFAQCGEHVIMGHDTSHEQVGQAGWLEWCQAHRAWLAARYLATVAANEPVRSFFGSWFDIEGWSQCGYYLGEEIIAAWQADLSLAAIARLPWPAARRRLHASLTALAGALAME